VGQLSDPDDAMILPDGRLIFPDILNGRLLFVQPGASAPSARWARLAPSPKPPAYFGNHRGVFPTRDGRYRATEINADGVNATSLTGSVAWSTHPPGVTCPWDTSEISAGRYLTVNYSTPGQVVVFNRNRQRSLDLPPDLRCPAQPALMRAFAAQRRHPRHRLRRPPHQRRGPSD
jgi:hypothetical protein